MTKADRCGTCRRLPYGIAKRGCIGEDIDVDCLRARAERLQAERDGAVKLLRRWNKSTTAALASATSEFLADLDAKGADNEPG